MSRDPVCGKEVDSLRARAVGIWGGRTYYFCSPEHKAEFALRPTNYGEHGAREPTIQGQGQAQVPALARSQSQNVRAPSQPARSTTPLPSPRSDTPPRGARGEERFTPPGLRTGATPAPIAGEGSDKLEVPMSRAGWKVALVFALAVVALVVALLAHR